MAAIIHNTIQDLANDLERGQRLIGLDIGDKTIGVAISDPLFSLASPMKTIVRTKKFKSAVDELRGLISKEDVGGMIAGLPINMDGTEGPRSQATRDLTRELVKQLELPAAFWDERLSTSAVEKFLINEADMNRKRRKDVIDKMAAAYILQGALDTLERPDI
jgi:putative Holliday junction resolvase